jgi:hypothetical protein
MSDARRAVVWLMTLIAVVIAGDHLLAIVLHRVLTSSQFRYSRLYRGGNDAEVLIIGDSRGVHSFYAPALQEMTGLRAFNLSYNSLSPRVAEAVLLDYLERNRAPRMVIIEATSTITDGAVKTELRTFGSFSPRLTALYAEEHPVAARVGRLLWLYPLNSTFFIESLHYMGRSDQGWINHDSMPAGLRATGARRTLTPIANEVDALARIVRVLRQRGIEVRLVIAPYAPITPLDGAPFASLIEQRTGVRVADYGNAIDDLDSFADTVHLNEKGSRAFLAMLARDGVFGMARRAARF